MLNRLLFTHRKPAQLIAAITGALFGFLLLLGTLLAYFDLTAAINGTGDLARPQYLVINKEVNMLNTLFGGQKGFSKEELNALRHIEGVKNVAGLTASHFKINLTMGPGQSDMMKGMYMELFFEAVPDEFIDADADGWEWQEGDSLIPIIIPRDYVKLYNFGYAPTQGQPQVSESLFKLARANVNVRGPKGGARFTGRIAGFSERINTILAPKSFVDYANEKFGGVQADAKNPSRVIIQCEGPATSSLIDYFSDNGYETSAESIANSRLNSYLRIVMSVLVVIGSVIVLLALMVFIQYAQLLMSKSNYELETLIRIGYDYRKLAARYIRFYAMLYGAIYLVSIGILWPVKSAFRSFMSEKGFELPPGIDWRVLLAGLAFVILFILVNSLTVRRGLVRLAR